MSTSKEVDDLEQQSHSPDYQQPAFPAPVQHQHLPLHAHMEPEDVRASPFQIDLTPSLNGAHHTPPANPGPFGLCAFAVTSFCMGFYNLRAGINLDAPANSLAGPAMFAAGFGQLIAGILEYRNGNTFGGTTFSAYGLYWISYSTFLIPAFGVSEAYVNYSNDYMTAMGLYLLGWTIFTFMMWTLTWRSNIAASALFFCLGLTYTFGTISNLAHLGLGNVVQRIGGAFGVLTGCISWYYAMADLSNTQNSYYTLPLGRFGRH
ncbi:hypothetical protein BGZ98_004717 [Dissophora globulifera]|nr:hypothetical protein BGZ98_004717 [Dissophora globulifera]